MRARPDESRSALGVGAQGLETVVLTGLSALSHRPSFSATPVPALEAHGVGRRLSQGCRDLSGEAALPSVSRSSLQPSGAPTHGLFLGHCVTAGEGEAGRVTEEGVWGGHGVRGSPSSLRPRHPALRQPHLVLRPNCVIPALPIPLGGWGEPWPQELSQPRPPASASSRPLLQEAFSPERGLGMIPHCGLPLGAGMGVWIEF